MFASIAVHPEEYDTVIKTFLSGDQYSQESLDQKVASDMIAFKKLLNQAKQTSQLVAIGEIGLDYYRLKVKGLKRQLVEKMQKEAFTKQLKLAFEYSLPVILHVRDQADRYELTEKITSNAYYDVYTIVSELVSNYESQNKQVPPLILHCASGPLDYIQKFLALGAYIGFAGNVTYDNAPELREILKITPQDKILLETDAPYLAPNQLKAELCKPHYITQTAQFLEHSYGINLGIIAENTLKVFPQFSAVLQKE